jgi:hypothetical protein
MNERFQPGYPYQVQFRLAKLLNEHQRYPNSKGPHAACLTVETAMNSILAAITHLQLEFSLFTVALCDRRTRTRPPSNADTCSGYSNNLKGASSIASKRKFGLSYDNRERSNGCCFSRYSACKNILRFKSRSTTQQTSSNDHSPSPNSRSCRI